MAGAVAGAVMGFFPFVRGTRVPLLGGVDLGFHELGHMLTYPFPEVVTGLMGSVTQIAVPLGLAAYFWFRRRDLLGVGLCLAWAGTSAWDVSVYIADAPYQHLPLIGGRHDWAYLLGSGGLGNLGAAAGIAKAVEVMGALLVVAGIVVCFLGPLRHREPTSTQMPKTLPVREPRRWAGSETLRNALPPETPGG